MNKLHEVFLACFSWDGTLRREFSHQIIHWFTCSMSLLEAIFVSNLPTILCVSCDSMKTGVVALNPLITFFEFKTRFPPS